MRVMKIFFNNLLSWEINLDLKRYFRGMEIAVVKLINFHDQFSDERNLFGTFNRNKNFFSHYVMDEIIILIEKAFLIGDFIWVFYGNYRFVKLILPMNYFSRRSTCKTAGILIWIFKNFNFFIVFKLKKVNLLQTFANLPLIITKTYKMTKALCLDAI